MTELTNDIPTETDTKSGLTFQRTEILSKAEVVQKYQTLLLQLQTQDPFLKEFLEQEAKTEYIDIVLGFMPLEETFKLQFNQHRENFILNEAQIDAQKINLAFKTQLGDVYELQNHKLGFLTLYELLPILSKMENIFEAFDLIVMVGTVITHPEKGFCYLEFSEGDTPGTIAVSCIEVSYFFANLNHYWFLTKMDEVDKTEKTNTTTSTPGPDDHMSKH